MRDDGDPLDIPFEEPSQFSSDYGVHQQHGLKAFQYHFFCFIADLVDQFLTRGNVHGEESPLVRGLETGNHFFFQRLF